MVSYNVLWWSPQVDNKFKEYDKKTSNFKILKVMKSTSKTKLHHLFLSITFNDHFEDLKFIFYVWDFNTTIEVIMKQI